MRPYALIFALLLISAAPLPLHAQSIKGQNYTRAEANLTLSNASAYVSMINQSSYIFSSPDLKQAYSYLNEAELLLNKSPGSSVLYSNLAVSSARSAYKDIGAYRQISELGALVFTIVMALLLYRFMRPLRRKGGR